MRRSAAPSQCQGNSAKKPRFIPPGKNNTICLKKENEQLVPEMKLTEVEEKQQSSSGHIRALSRICGLNINSAQAVESLGEINCMEKCNGENEHKAAGMKRVNIPKADLMLKPTPEIARHKEEEDECDYLAKYFSVVWCKASKKKHKKWEGDAVLIAKGKSVILKDMEGKDIGRGTGYKSKDLESLGEGQTLIIGGKEIEVMGIISAEEFNSGKCFQNDVGTSSIVPTASSQCSLKPFCCPLKNLCNPSTKQNLLKDSQNYKPRHDPDASNSLVMPRPTPDHQRIFNKAGIPVVDVVVDPYLVNHLRPHQKEGIVFLYECVMGMRLSGRFGAILADEMGLGKTLQCISLVWTLLHQGLYGCKPIIKKALIVTPGSLVKNWKKEFQKWLGSERIKVFTVDQDNKVEEFINSPLYSVLIISYEMVLRSLDQIQAIEFNLLICDEGHRLKNSSIKTTSALISLPCEKRIILTGTPIQNDLQEFYALIEFVNPGILGSLSTYRKIYEEPVIRSREPSATKEEKELGEKRAAELTRLTGLFILRRTQEIINKFLPPKKETILFCRPTVLQLGLYRKLLRSRVVRSCLQGVLENSPHLICIGALKKLCNHPCLLFKAIKEKESNPTCDECEESNLYEGLRDIFPEDYTFTTFTETDSGKLQVLAKLLETICELSPSERIVLVSHYTQTLNILQDLCKHYGYSYTRLDGHTPISQRQQIVDSFNNKFCSTFIFLLSSKAGGVGLNLIGASHLILYDIDWNPATDIQAMARVWRDGQKHTVHIYRLLTTGSIEEKIYQRQISKQGLSGAVIDLSKTSEHIRFSTEELRNLFILHEDSNCVTHDLLECNCMGKKDHQYPSPEKLSVYTGCQHGQYQEKADAKKSLSMSQLMQWKHFSGQHQTLDPFLERIKKHISFIFQNVTNPATPT
uniref:DNA repair and recombination protein RAD54B n=2 Tax=Pelodiscus sinensis TaxID=13735 RepID=K7F309_PELSI|nr:DNA repair and recombination protein RAD54B isoform X1 [Pelodiscus sinensis]XP_014426961.1 DNA repair and recombination protein RAD54B isoform X1 [Pelodiscus sinensis]XP_025038303.1 DNA repair and recombination protein RAD54B isoform X1 [Pelodiscus sinensis]XP_025038310.1 DNA repair and recombination protein RAD54B isoform X1 [Pelodiscus sinensis]|eukprot:XP_006111066.1 DNA repair and recombination protein RAD54B isoform X1 [Pelodiscus sinensis]